MSTDRELLEMAAKAVGMHVKAHRVDADDNFTHLVVGQKFKPEKIDWNPLADDGDAPVVLPEPDAVLRFERSTAGKENEMPSVVSCNRLPDGEYKLYTEQQVRAMLATGGQAQAVPNGWREQFATAVYADLAAADNQDVPLEEYPARILKVLDSTVGPRHPVVIKWRNDAIEQCIAIARKYCCDPESHKYLKQDLEAMLTAEPAPHAQKGCNP